MEPNKHETTHQRHHVVTPKSFQIDLNTLSAAVNIVGFNLQRLVHIMGFAAEPISFNDVDLCSS